MIKNIHFYKMHLEKTNQTNLFEDVDTTLKSKVAKFMINCDETELSQIKNNNIFTLISFDEEHLYGTFGNVSDVIKGEHARGRNRTDLSVEEINNLLEIFTYFYLDLNSLNIALLYNSKIADFKKPFAEFITSHFRISNIFDTVSVIPLLSDDVPNFVGKKYPIMSIKAVYSDNKLPDNEFLSIKEIADISKNDVKNTMINISLKEIPNKSWKINPFKKDKYSELKVETASETIDLIEGIVTKKAFIEVDKDELKDIDIIKDKLTQSLLLIDNS